MIEGQMNIYECLDSESWDDHVPRPTEIETFTGRYVDLAAPQPHMICLEDVAHGLANTCRYNGQVEFYSVAQHAVLCSWYLHVLGHPRDIQLAGLHHDDAEAYLGDVTRPLKSLLQPAYGALSDAMDDAIVAALGLPWSGDALSVPEVKEADNALLMLEAHNLLPSKGRHWGGLTHAWDLSQEKQSDVLNWTGCWTPSRASMMFIQQHLYLTKEQ